MILGIPLVLLISSMLMGIVCVLPTSMHGSYAAGCIKYSGHQCAHLWLKLPMQWRARLGRSMLAIEKLM